MFFHIYLDRNMQLHPRHFGPHLRDKLIAKLIQDVEGTCRYSFRFSEHRGNVVRRELICRGELRVLVTGT